MTLDCPVPMPEGDRVLLAHGEGLRLTRGLIRDLLLPAFDNRFLRPLADAAVLPPIDGEPVMTTDTYVVTPLFFPGGDIGSLAVHGTVNDLTACGAVPLYLSVALILEEGLPLPTLRRVVESVAVAAAGCGVCVVTGDTKVVPRGAVDQLFVSVTGLGRRRGRVRLGSERVRPGDRVVVTGTLGDHGVAVLSAREQLDFAGALRNDSAALHALVGGLWDTGIDVHFLRDPTRGGVAAVLHELTEAAAVSVEIESAAVPLSDGVRGASELLGLDPLFIANEGKMVVVIAPGDEVPTLECLRRHPLGRDAAVIGTVTAGRPPEVRVRSALGALRALDDPRGAPLPRIC